MIELRELTVEDYDEVVALWRETEGVSVRPADSREGVARYLARNPGGSFVARAEGRIVGAVLCGHDGRRGYLHHLAVAPAYRRRGLGRRLVERGLARLREQGIDKCHLFVFADNEAGHRFWIGSGWHERPDLVLLSRDLEP